MQDPWEQRRVGSYDIEQVLAQGGQGMALRARHRDLGRSVVLKLLLSADPKARKRFLREARSLAEVRHPNLVRVHEVFEVDGAPFIAMELIAGEDLERWVARNGPPPVAWTVRVLEGVASALAHCHAHDLVHRDVKPANVLVEADTDRPVLVDFGLVKRDRQTLSETPLTASGEVLGTPSYMAPEQIDPHAFGPVGPAADVYGLGGLLHFLLTGQRPFTGPTAYNIINAVLTRPAPDPRQANPAVPPALADLCLRALDKAQARRPPSCEAFVAGLRGRAAPADPAQEERARPPWLALVLAAALGALGALGAATLWPLAAPRPGADAAPPEPGPDAGAPEPGAEVGAADAADAADSDLGDSRASAAQDREDAEPPQPAPATTDPAVATLLERGRKTRLAMDSRGSVSAYSAAIALDPTCAQAFTGRARTWRRLGRFEAAVADATQAMILEPNLLEAHHERGMARYYAGDYEPALEDLERVLVLEGSPPHFWNLMARAACLEKLGRHRDALEDRRRGASMATRPDDVGFARLKQLECMLALGERPAALALLREWIEDAEPELRWRHLMHLATLEAEAGNLQAALASAELAAAISERLGGPGEADLTRGRILMELRRPADARAALQQALARGLRREARREAEALLRRVDRAPPR